MKSDFFSEEKEWRLVYNPNSDENTLPQKHRCGPIGITPYIEIELDNIDDYIAEIVTGPKFVCVGRTKKHQ